MTLHSLPAELVLRISVLLSPLCSFYLSLTSRKLATILLPRARIVTLSYAADLGKRDLFLRVLEEDIDFNFTLDNRTILEELILNRRDDYVIPLLDRGVGLVSPLGSICAEDGVNLLHLAAAAGCGDAVLKRLLVHGGDVDPFAMDDEGLTPLICATNEGNVGAVKTLIDVYHEKNREIDPPDSKYPLLLQATLQGQGEVVLFLLQTREVRVNARGRTGENALHWMSQTSMRQGKGEDEDSESNDMDIKVMNALLAAGVSLSDRAAEERLTPLHSAAQHGRWDLIPPLVSAGADLTARCSLGGTPLHWAARGGSVRTIDTLVDLGANIHATDSDNKTPLLWAYNVDLFGAGPELDPSPSPIFHLIRHGADMSHQDAAHQTILHLVAFHNRYDAATKLLAAGIDVNIQSINGSTALHLAALNGSHRTAVQLLRAQPELELLNTLGQSALDVAVDKGHDHIAALIRRYIHLGAKIVGGVIDPEPPAIG
ncbi:hypothetical protein MferCBS31731_002811 [Microsporum ferrugineum]